MKDAISKYKEFTLKEPDKILELENIPDGIPRVLYPVGFAVQISYYSNKWHKGDNYEAYIHYFEHPTIVHVTKDMIDSYKLDGFHSDFNFVNSKPKERATFLGYAIDFNYSNDDRTKIKLTTNPTFIRKLNPQSPQEYRKLHGAMTVEFDSDPVSSQDYVCCSPDGKVVYIVSNRTGEIFAFVNKHCKVTMHGIEG